ncbi:hypothetical protein SISNIDRAFT_468305 [Sistotremastrum niveocremeum HHB9708]|uniref:Uncharacterized protein n=1 Tax=Sistotremastrum niveocremeum HHB9708 TaxID=1314777 RepID=A0A164RR35_9AGAM|nr:hypothetical protein SISNIDRAFT_468305 [Sistotremastrum niveocremeum HHB9708]
MRRYNRIDRAAKFRAGMVSSEVIGSKVQRLSFCASTVLASDRSKELAILKEIVGGTGSMLPEAKTEKGRSSQHACSIGMLRFWSEMEQRCFTRLRCKKGLASMPGVSASAHESHDAFHSDEDDKINQVANYEEENEDTREIIRQGQTSDLPGGEGEESKAGGRTADLIQPHVESRDLVQANDYLAGGGTTTYHEQPEIDDSGIFAWDRGNTTCCKLIRRRQGESTRKLHLKPAMMSGHLPLLILKCGIQAITVITFDPEQPPPIHAARVVPDPCGRSEDPSTNKVRKLICRMTKRIHKANLDLKPETTLASQMASQY